MISRMRLLVHAWPIYRPGLLSGLADLADTRGQQRAEQSRTKPSQAKPSSSSNNHLSSHLTITSPDTSRLSDYRIMLSSCPTPCRDRCPLPSHSKSYRQSVVRAKAPSSLSPDRPRPDWRLAVGLGAFVLDAIPVRELAEHTSSSLCQISNPKRAPGRPGSFSQPQVKPSWTHGGEWKVKHQHQSWLGGGERG